MFSIRSIFLLLAALCASARAEPVPPSDWVLSVMTYNIHGITPFAHHDAADKGPERNNYDEIAARLRRLRAEGKAPHVVVIQEAFNPWSMKAALDSGYPYVVQGRGPRFGTLGGSGLFILSEYPIQLLTTLDYADCTGFDCWANKGAMHARIMVPERMQAFDLYNTHMNANSGVPPTPSSPSMKARLAQIRDYAAFVRRTRDPEIPAILSGDFNMRVGNPDYALFSSLLEGINAGEACQAAECTGGDPAPILKETVDHHFTLNGARMGLVATHFVRAFTEAYRGGYLSDHAALQANFRLDRP